MDILWLIFFGGDSKKFLKVTSKLFKFVFIAKQILYSNKRFTEKNAKAISFYA